MHRPSRAIGLSVLFVGVALTLHEPLRSGALTALRFPFTLAKTCVTIVLSLPRLPFFLQEHAALRTELLQERLENAQLREALRSAQRADVLSRAAPVGRAGVVASVVSRSMIPMQQTVLVNKGARHGLTVESAVMEASGLIGRVVEVHPATALVMLLTDPESRVAGMVERSREMGLLIGRGHGRCELIYLDVQADVEEGDRVVTAGLGGSFPKGLVLGRVTRVTRDEQAGTAWASVTPSAPLGRLEDVLCLPAPDTASGTGE